MRRSRSRRPSRHVSMRSRGLPHSSSSPPAPQPAPGTPTDLTLEEATTRALERNLELAVERLNPQTFDLTIARLRAVYHPIATSLFTQRAVTQPPTNQLN